METKKSEPELISTEGLAEMLSVSKKFIINNRNRIVGGVKIGRLWRFQISEIRKRIATGKNILN
jgi:hypothetical protein